MINGLIHKYRKASGPIRFIHLIFGGFLLLEPSLMRSQDTFQLAPPFVRYSSVFVDEFALVEVQFDQPGAEVHYTTNGLDPTLSDPICPRHLQLPSGFISLKVRSFGPDFLPSETVTATFMPVGWPITVESSTLPDQHYSGNGPMAMVDHQGGNSSYAAPGWLGFQNDTVFFTLDCGKKQKPAALLIHFLEDQGAWIFLPEKVEVDYWDKKKQKFMPWASWHSASQEKTTKKCVPVILKPDRKKRAETFRVKIYVLKQIPAWHPGKGQKSWIFMDEIKIYGNGALD